MTLNNEDLPAAARREFCAALKAARERAGISLSGIAQATKIPAFLFEALERGDLRRWPNGLFRRSFFRDYVKAIGVPVDETCQEFARLFSDGGWPQPASDSWGQPPVVAYDSWGQPPAVGAAGEITPEVPARLVMDPAWHGPRPALLTRLCIALIDAGTVVTAGLAIASVGGLDWPITVAIAALTYFSVATIVSGSSPAAWLVARRQPFVDAVRNAPTAFAAMWIPPAQPEEPEVRPWYSDAHRVGPPRLRVRIKMPH